MRGLIFNSLLDYIESERGYSCVDKLIGVTGGSGVYADGGMYDDQELIQIINVAAAFFEVSIDEFEEQFGFYAFKPLYKKLLTIYDFNSYKQEVIVSSFDFIVMLNEIHCREVNKLYPDSAFPHFDVLKQSDKALNILYSSERHLPYVAKGLFLGCGNYFEENLSVEMKERDSDGATTFIIRRDGNG